MKIDRNILWAFCVCALVGGACPADELAAPIGPADEARVDAFRQKWGEREERVSSTAERVRLARDLCAAAKQAQDPAMKLLLCEHAFGWAQRDCPEGLPMAREALGMIQQIDPSRRLDCLVKLSAFNEQAWRESRLMDYRSGAEVAITSMQKAHQRLLDAVKLRDDGKITDTGMMQQLDQCRRDYSLAFATLSRAVLAARDSEPDESDAEAHRKFVTELASYRLLSWQIEHGQRELDRIYKSAKDQGVAALAEFRPSAKPPAAEPAPAVAVAPAVEPVRPVEPAPPVEPVKPVEPAPPVEPVKPEVAEGGKPAPEPAVPDDPAIPPTVTGSDSVLHGIRCVKCGEMFVPEVGSKIEICYWCRKGKRLFELGRFGK